MIDYHELARILAPYLQPWILANGFGVSARAYNSAAISVPNNTLTDLTFNSEYWDTDTIHNTSSNTGRMTIVHGGTYMIVGQVEWAAAAGGRRQILIVLNGATTIAVAENDNVPAGAVNLQQTVATVYQLVAGDYVTLRVFQNSGGALNVNAQANWSPELSIARIV